MKLFTALFTILPSLAFAQYAAPTGFQLLSYIPGQPVQQVGASSANPNWQITVSGPPATINPLVATPTSYGSTNPSLVVQVQMGGKVIAIGQFGTGVACTTSTGAASEYDVDMAPGKSAKPVIEPNLSDMTSLIMSGGIIISNAGSTPGVPACKVNKTSATIGAVFIDTSVTPEEQFYYAINLFSSVSNSTKPGGWYWTGNHTEGKINDYGYSDSPSSYGMTAPPVGNTTSNLSFNLASRIAAIIQSGQTNIDTNLSHWTLENIDYGQAHWGNAFLVTSWSGWVPQIVTK